MDGHRFDDLARTLAAPRTRRGFLVALAALGSGLAGGRAAAAPGNGKPGRCGEPGHPCKFNRQCCEGTGSVCLDGACTCPGGPAPDPALGCVAPTTTTAPTTTPAPTTTTAAPTTAAPTTTTTTTLAPVDECAPGTGACDVNATCTDTDDGYTCACNAGFVGDGFTCAPETTTTTTTPPPSCAGIPDGYACAFRRICVDGACVATGGCTAEGTEGCGDPSCSDYGTYCLMTLEGTVACAGGVDCSEAQLCTSSAGCPAGQLCFYREGVNDACPGDVCRPVCAGGSADTP